MQNFRRVHVGVEAVSGGAAEGVKIAHGMNNTSGMLPLRRGIARAKSLHPPDAGHDRWRDRRHARRLVKSERLFRCDTMQAVAVEGIAYTSTQT